MCADTVAVTTDGVFADTGEACGLADAATLSQVSEDGTGLLRCQASVEQGSALAFGEAGLAGGAAQESAAVWAVPHGHGEVAVVAFAVVSTVGIQTTKAAEIVSGPSLAHALLRKWAGYRTTADDTTAPVAVQH